MRDRESPSLDVLAAGQVFLDLVYAGLEAAPAPGREVWSPAFGYGPGGIANAALAAARLGASAAVVAGIGTDDLSDLCTRLIAREGVDVGGLVPIEGWRLPVTTALELDGDRALLTGGTPVPRDLARLTPDGPPPAATAVVHLEPGTAEFVARTAANGTRVFACVGWDPSLAWDLGSLGGLAHCHAVVPNEAEATAFTHTDSAEQAASALAELVPLAVVTRGERGAIAVDAGTGERVVAPAAPVRAVDSTGAGDVFCAALAVAALEDWSLAERVDFACLVAGLTVARPGGASTAPTSTDLDAWIRSDPGDRYRFILDRRRDLPRAVAPHRSETP